jgi:hypothetical protein
MNIESWPSSQSFFCYFYFLINFEMPLEALEEGVPSLFTEIVFLWYFFPVQVLWFSVV